MMKMAAAAKFSEHPKLKAYTQLIHPAVSIIQQNNVKTFFMFA
jgi:hypothetical protein